MKWIGDNVVHHVRAILDEPDLSGTHYEMVHKVASGGMGSVYLVKDTRLGRQVALKVMNFPDVSGDLCPRMMREAQIIAQLEHPSIVPIYDVGALPDGRVFYAMKYVQGQRLDQCKETPNPELLRIFQKACEAVAYAHAHDVIHRDLKPENIMVGSFGEVLVMDWGVAKMLAPNGAEGSRSTAPAGEPSLAMPFASRPLDGPRGPGQPTLYGTILGTPSYMAPEQARGEIDKLDRRADVYALGAILYYLLTSRPPVEVGPDRDSLEDVVSGKITPPRSLAPEVSRSLEGICLKALARDSGSRYPDAGELAAELGRYLGGLPVLAYRETLFERLARIMRQNRTLVWLVVAYLLMRLLVLLLTGR